MKIGYDPREDVLYLHFKNGPAHAVEEAEDNVIVELDENSKVMGMELWGVRRRGLLKQLVELTVAR